MCFKVLKRIFILVTCICILVVNVGVHNVYAAYDEGSSLRGFQVDTEQYFPVNWYSEITTNVYMNGERIGYVTTEVGTTRARFKEKNSYLDIVMIKSTTRGVDNGNGYVGYTEHLTYECDLDASMDLISCFPESEKDTIDETYSFGVNLGKESSISATTEVTNKSLYINNYSDTAGDERFKVCYDYVHSHVLRALWRKNNYSFQKTDQRAQFVYKAKSPTYSLKLKVKAKFERWFSAPGYWAETLFQCATNETTITIRNPKYFY